MEDGYSSAFLQGGEDKGRRKEPSKKVFFLLPL